MSAERYRHLPTRRFTQRQWEGIPEIGRSVSGIHRFLGEGGRALVRIWNNGDPYLVRPIIRVRAVCVRETPQPKYDGGLYHGLARAYRPGGYQDPGEVWRAPRLVHKDIRA